MKEWSWFSGTQFDHNWDGIASWEVHPVNSKKKIVKTFFFNFSKGKKINEIQSIHTYTNI